jgi:hypothetical protein
MDAQGAAAWLDEVGTTEGSMRIIAQCYSSVDLGKAIEWARRCGAEGRDNAIAQALAEARIRDPEADITAYLGAGTLPAEEMQARVAEVVAQRQLRD